MVVLKHAEADDADKTWLSVVSSIAPTLSLPVTMPRLIHCFWALVSVGLIVPPRLRVVAAFIATCRLPATPFRSLQNDGATATTMYATSTIDTSFMWNRGLNYGKGQFKFYSGFDKWMSVFPEEDRKAYPSIFNFPDGVYEVELQKPLGIIFEEIELGKGLYVQDLVEGGNADVQGIIKKDDVLVGITATKVVGAKYERRLIPCRGFSFDTMVGAVESNQPRFGCETVILAFERPSQADPAKTNEFMAFFEPPFDTPWKQAQ